MSQEHASINGALLRLRREARGWVQTDVATRACMSVKQIKQLEDGGLSAFYSEAVKVTAAKKVGALLGLTSDEVFSHGQPEVVTASSLSPDAALAELLASTHEASHEPEHHPYVEAPAAAHDVQEPEAEQAPPFYLNTPAEVEVAEPAAHVDVTASDAHESASNETTPAKSKTSLAWVLALFVGAIVLAAVFKQDPEPAAVAEPPPPLQPALQGEPASEGAKDGAKEGVPPTDANAPAAPATPASAVAPANAPAPVTTPAVASPVVPSAPTAAPSAPLAAPAVAPKSVAPAAPAATTKPN